MPIFIHVDIMEDVIESFAQKLSGSLGPGGTYSEALQGWLLNFGEDSKRLHNGSLTWADYHAYISVRLIVLDKQPGVCPVGLGEMWRRLFTKCVLRVTGPEATSACNHDQIFDGLKMVIDGGVHGVQAIWDTNLATEYWVLILVDANIAFNNIN